MKYSVVFRVEARDEALAAAEYIAEHASPEVAGRWYEALEAAIKSLATMPRRCPLAREHGSLAGVELRQLVVHSHRLIFTIRASEVHVLHVRHAACENFGEP
jgi:plasmid stabilization system protein ParE